jgi:hypothetical protein
VSVEAVQHDRLHATEFAAGHRVHVVLKGIERSCGTGQPRVHQSDRQLGMATGSSRRSADRDDRGVVRRLLDAEAACKLAVYRAPPAIC